MADQYSVYVYPNISRDRMGSNNPYIENLKRSLSLNGFQIDPSVSKYAFYDLISKGLKFDMVVLNWVENVPTRRFGMMQTLLFSIYLGILKISGVRIVWIRHNRISHDKDRFALKKMLVSILLRFSDHIITHSNEVDPNSSKKIVFMPHPVNVHAEDVLNPSVDDDLPIDFLIWGTVLPYKGILEFLTFVSNDQAIGKYNIHIAGRCTDARYWTELTKLKGQNVEIVNKYLEADELRALFQRSRCILFTYNKESILSSGVLMDSLIARKRIIAPDCGAFRDLAGSDGFVSIYENFSQISGIYADHFDDFILDHDKIQHFFSQNSWDRLGAKLKQLSN